ncbi:MAG: FAD-dependent oxidoreductase [Saprospiraceae bacterium]|nr:FAD-dependent oxidoreductase [Saprospiraceae bacterium]MCB9309514.1 FAD-dependent oxidoreductase [Lewinellaceae bacterium]
MKRREFLIKSSLAGSTLVVQNKNFAKSSLFTRKPKSVIIIGAGFSGLAAAMKLRENSINVTVLEARNRVGGRVFSFQPKSTTGQVIELGAEWVGNSHERIKSLCGEFGLTLENNQFETDLILNGKHSRQGQWNFSQEMQEFWNRKSEIWEAMTESEKQKLDRTDWWRLLSSKGFSDRDLLLRELIDSTDFGESIRHTSAFAAFAEYAESSEKNEMDLKIKGGNNLLAQKMAESIGYENILLQHSVQTIDQDHQNVYVTDQGGKTFTADSLICAIPTFALMKIEWKSKLPTHTIDALHALQYARIGKFPIAFSTRFWERDDFDMITDTPAHYFYHGTKNQEGKYGVLMCYAIGEKADVLASVNAQQRKDIIFNALKPAFGNVTKYAIEDLMYYWGQDKYSAGAYAFYGKNQWFDVMPTLKKSHENIHFAGEHLADWQGFMEGAVNSGEEVAEQILAG